MDVCFERDGGEWQRVIGLGRFAVHENAAFERTKPNLLILIERRTSGARLRRCGGVRTALACRAGRRACSGGRRRRNGSPKRAAEWSDLRRAMSSRRSSCIA
jgi:hypothetical protein